ncbi:senescence-associated protein-domain-containing protein [Powellomyces hirtus]|nr:senescence-associated protein-domain-containing protein [Powellomyces hirtus]
MSALSFQSATITLVPQTGAPASPFGRGHLIVEQDHNGNIFLQGSDWRLSLPPTTRADRIADMAYIIHLPPTASLSRTSSPQQYSFENGAADLRVDFDAADANSVAIFDMLFADEGAPPAYPAPGEEHFDHRNSLAVVNDHGDVVGVVAEGVELQHPEGRASPTYDSDNDSVVIELNTLPTVDLGGQAQEKPVAVRVNFMRDPSSTVLLTSEYVSTGLVVGGSVLGKAMKSGATSLKTLIPVAATPWQPSAGTKQNIDKFHSASKTTAETTKRIAETVASVASSVGQKVVHHATRSKNGEEKPPSASWELLKNTVHAVGTVLDAVSDAGKSLYQDTVEATSGLVQHRYGAEAGDAVRTGLGAVGNVGLIYFDAKGIGRRAFLKHAAKGAITNVKLKDGRVVSLGKREDLKKSGIFGPPTAGPSSIAGPSAQGPVFTAHPPPAQGNKNMMYKQ